MRPPLPGAHITAVLTGTGIRMETDADQNGVFALDLANGEYTLTVNANGFETLSRLIKVSGSAEELVFTLSIAAAHAEVTVNDTASPLGSIGTATRTFTPLRDVPQAVVVIRKDQIQEQAMTSVADLVRYVPGVQSHQGENNRDEVVIRGNKSNADFFRDGVRDDVQYYRDPYNMERFEALKGPNAMIFGRGGGGGVINRVTKEAGILKTARIHRDRRFVLRPPIYGRYRSTADRPDRVSAERCLREGAKFRHFVGLERTGINPALTFSPDPKTSVHISYEFLRDRRMADRGMTSFQNRPVDLPISTYYGNPRRQSVRASVNMLSGSVERLFGDMSFETG